VLLALATVVLVLLASVATSAPGALIFFVLFVPAFLCELVADPRFLSWKPQQFLSFVAEPCLPSLFERPPPTSLA